MSSLAHACHDSKEVASHCWPSLCLCLFVSFIGQYPGWCGALSRLAHVNFDSQGGATQKIANRGVGGVVGVGAFYNPIKWHINFAVSGKICDITMEF